VAGGAVGAALLAGCAGGGSGGGGYGGYGGAGMPAPASPKSLTASPCSGPEVQVTLGQVTISGSTATLQVNPGQRTIGTSPGGVRWKFTQNTYSFTSDGVTFKPNQPPGPANAVPGTDPTEYAWCFNSTASSPDTTWRYNIKFFANANPSAVWQCDPTIVNRSSLAADASTSTVSCVPAP
jgi:hypothetical protein